MNCYLILAGGRGERFWPLSTERRPKQFLSYFSDKPLIVKAYERILPLVSDKGQIFISTDLAQVPALREAIPSIDDRNIIVEPVFKDTAAAIAYGSLIISKYYSDPTITVLSSDHLIRDEDDFRQVLQIASDKAGEPAIVTLGIKPTYPETGYGYIEVAEAPFNHPVPSLRFHEKPNEDCARNYFESGRFLWNSGMFVFRLSTLLDAFGKYAPEYLSFFNKLNRTISFNQGETTANRVAPLFAPLPKKSIDFAVLEKAQNIFVVPSAFGWDDVGNYLAFDRLFPHDECNSVSVNAVPISVDSSNNIVIGTVSKKKILILGISNCIIVDSNDGLLISSKTAVNKLKVALEKAK